MTPRLNRYLFCFLPPFYYIFRYTQVDNQRIVSTAVKGEPAYLDEVSAARRVYELNGWDFSRYRAKHTPTTPTTDE